MGFSHLDTCCNVVLDKEAYDTANYRHFVQQVRAYTEDNLLRDSYLTVVDHGSCWASDTHLLVGRSWELFDTDSVRCKQDRQDAAHVGTRHYGGSIAIGAGRRQDLEDRDFDLYCDWTGKVMAGVDTHVAFVVHVDWVVGRCVADIEAFGGDNY